MVWYDRLEIQAHPTLFPATERVLSVLGSSIRQCRSNSTGRRLRPSSVPQVTSASTRPSRHLFLCSLGGLDHLALPLLLLPVRGRCFFEPTLGQLKRLMTALTATEPRKNRRPDASSFGLPTVFFTSVDRYSRSSQPHSNAGIASQDACLGLAYGTLAAFTSTEHTMYGSRY